MLIPPRLLPKPLLAAPGHAYNLSAPGEISTGEVGNFQPAETGEYSTGVDMRNQASWINA
jgi:hypothetical protein